MKIVILDGHTANPGDLSWQAFERYGELAVYPRTSRGEVVARCAGADAVLTNKVPIGVAEMDALPGLRYIGVLATGYNVVDVAAALQRGITVTNIPSYSTMSVAQSVFALLLAVTNRVEHYTELNRQGRWSRSEDFSYQDIPPVELAGKRLGIVGYGHIGSVVASIGSALGMEIALYTSKPASALPAGYVKLELDELFATSFALSLHCPLTDTTFHLADARRLALMQPGAVLINTGRGPLVDEQALADALNSGHLRGAGIDVLAQEPPAADNPLLSARNCFITPHIAWATLEARSRLIEIAAGNLGAFIEGSPVNVVS